jgi:hypothetical protein
MRIRESFDEVNEEDETLSSPRKTSAQTDALTP